MSVTWTEEQDELLKRFWLAGLSASQIANTGKFGDRSRNAIIGRLHRMRCTRPVMAKQEDASLSAVEARPKRATRLRVSYSRMGAGPLPKPRRVDPVDAPPVEGDRWGCQYIAADHDLGNAPRCGEPRVHIAGRDSPYCGAHHAICYRPKGEAA